MKISLTSVKKAVLPEYFEATYNIFMHFICPISYPYPLTDFLSIIEVLRKDGTYKNVIIDVIESYKSGV